MTEIVQDDGSVQPLLFDTGEPVRAKPSQDEHERTLQWAARMAIAKRHHGRPPKSMSWEDLRQEVILITLDKVKDFRHGGPKRIDEFYYLAACFALADIQREYMREWASDNPKIYPLFDDDGAVTPMFEDRAESA